VELNDTKRNGQNKMVVSVVTLFNKINITIVIFLLIPRILNSPFSVLQLSLNVTFVARVQNYSIAVITFYLLRPLKLTNQNQSQIQSVQLFITFAT
jgi:hypothetical protein